MKIKDRPIWYYLIPKSWRSCLYFADLEMRCDETRNRRVHHILYYVYSGKLSYYWDKVTGKGQYRIGQHTGQYLWILRLRVWFKSSYWFMHTRIHNFFMCDVPCWWYGHVWDIVDWENVDVWWIKNPDPNMHIPDHLKNETRQPVWVMLECTRCGRAKTIHAVENTPITNYKCSVCGINVHYIPENDPDGSTYEKLHGRCPVCAGIISSECLKS